MVLGFVTPSVQVFLTCVVWLSAALSCHGATLPGREKRILPSLMISSDTKVTLMRTVAPEGRLPTLMVNTSCSEHKNNIKTSLQIELRSGGDYFRCPWFQSKIHLLTDNVIFSRYELFYSLDGRLLCHCEN